MLIKKLKKIEPSSISRTCKLKLENWRVSRTPFYRHYKYRGRLPYKPLDWHTVIDFELGILFHRIPKVANSSLLASIMQLKTDSSLSVDQNEKRRIRHQFTRPSELSSKEVSNVRKLYKAVFVRNPYSRVLSAYLSKVAGKVRLGEKITLNYHRFFGPDFNNGKTFIDFCRFLEEGGIEGNRHWAPQIDFLFFPVQEYDFIGRFECLAKDFEKMVLDFTDKKNKRTVINEDPSHATNADEKIYAHYTREAYDIISKLYDRDFQAFGYQKR